MSKRFGEVFSGGDLLSRHLQQNYNGPLGKNVITHEVKFRVVTTGDITPAWKLVQVNVNQTGNLFEVSRLRTHDLLITMGPAISKDSLVWQHRSPFGLANRVLSVSTNLRPELQF